MGGGFASLGAITGVREVSRSVSGTAGGGKAKGEIYDCHVPITKHPLLPHGGAAGSLSLAVRHHDSKVYLIGPDGQAVPCNTKQRVPCMHPAAVSLGSQVVVVSPSCSPSCSVRLKLTQQNSPANAHAYFYLCSQDRRPRTRIATCYSTRSACARATTRRRVR